MWRCLMTIKEVFDKAENGTLTYAQFEELTKDAKFADLSTGEYVSKRKYDDELASKDNQINTLNGTIKDRDKDLEALKTQLADAGTDAEKLTILNSDLEKLQGKYDADVKAYKEQLKKQAYEFAVKEYANTKEFSSSAAKRDFTNQMIQAKLKMKDGAILGATDFVELYSKENADAFLKEEPKPEDNPTPTPGAPHFVAPTPGSEPASGTGNSFANAFHFQTVRPMPTK